MSVAKLLTVSEVAERLRVSARTVRRHIARGHAPGVVDIGAGDVPRYRIPEADVARLQRRLRFDPAA